MRFEWDAGKDRRNRRKHGVSFDLARRVFDDPLHLSIQDRHEGEEERWQTMGTVGGVVLIASHTYAERDDEEVIRVISARKTTRRERISYEEDR